MGIIPFLRHILHPPLVSEGSEVLPSTKPQPRIDLYGPAGLRTFVRSILTMTLTKTADTYAVHELLTPTCSSTPIDAASLHSSECPGTDFLCDEHGFWRGFTAARAHIGDVIVDAGPISHRDPCIGYIIREPLFPGRKLGILGDTYDPSSLMPLLSSPPPSLLIHEATDAFIPLSVDPHARRKEQEVQQKVLARGHSTPVMAGEFARRVGAERLVLNHIGSRFPAPRQLEDAFDVRFAVIDEIARQASKAWGMGHAQVAFDFMKVTIPAPPSPMVHVKEEIMGMNYEADGNDGEQESGGGDEAEAEESMPGHNLVQWASGDRGDGIRSGRSARGRDARGRGIWRGGFRGRIRGNSRGGDGMYRKKQKQQVDKA
ncbi:hypothetical protein BS17DRAFT_726816 [Gyrodon lividus]|nr:hypothetical protein BS17DRAFT_726816 [Gyrodon lividus]